MVLNAWFYKLMDMGKSRSRTQINRKQTSSLSSSLFYSSSNLQQPHNLSYQRKSYYLSRNLSPNSHQSNETLSKHIPTCNNINFSEPPRQSSKKRRSTTRRKTSISPKCVNSPFSSSTTCSSEPESFCHSPKTFNAMILSPSCRRYNNIVIDLNMNINHGSNSVSKIDLPPIITKPKKLENSTKDKKKMEEKTEQSTSPKGRVSVSSSIGMKLRTKSPRIVSRKSIYSRTSVCENSFTVVKSSKDPHKDFKESMVEMIVKNNIKTSKDLEDLLACYLSLNLDQYHDLIIKVFKQIWFDI